MAHYTTSPPLNTNELPKLYPELTQILAISQFESNEIARKGRQLEALIKQYVA